MRLRVSRREFVSGLGGITAAAALPGIPGRTFLDWADDLPMDSSNSHSALSPAATSTFRIGVINDEISQDFGHACEVAAGEFGMNWIELRGMWNKNLLRLDGKEIEEALRILDKNKLRVTDIASPLFKVDWPGAPKSKYSPKRDQFNADFTFEEQDEVLDRSIELAKTFHTDRVRLFDFWRLEDQAPYRAAINEKLREAAEKAAKRNVILVLENEPACNTATAAEAAKVLKEVTSTNLMLNWDPGNAAEHGEKPFPDGYNLLPKERIGHCHCKDAIKKPDGTGYAWAAMGQGIIDWVGQFRALRKDGYHGAVSLETHWRGAGTAEESSRVSMKGMQQLLAKAES